MMGMYRWIPDVKTWREAVFSGHFGPMGIGAIFISTLAHEFLHNYVADNPSTTTSDDYQRHQIERVIDVIQPVVAFMVLCSIIIHGLSIPGFSLGLTVSRTWSRRDTNGSGRVAAPDWTNQATLVSRAEDIVINRDLERGEGGRGVPLEKTISMRTLNNDNGADDVDAVKSDSVGKETKDQVDRVSAITFAATPTQEDEPDDYPNQFPPDGEHRQTREWIEGSQKVVERRSGGLGDDVCFSSFIFLC